MIKLIIKNPNGLVETKEISENTTFSPSAGQQFYFDNSDGSRQYTFNLKDGESSIELVFAGNGERIVIVLENMADFIKASDGIANEKEKTVLGIMNDEDGLKELNETALNYDFEGDNVISQLKELLADTNNPDPTFLDGIVIDGFGALAEQLDAAAAGGEVGDTGGLTNDPIDPSGQVNSVVGRGRGTTFDPANPSGEVDAAEGDLSPVLIIGDAGTVYESGLLSSSDNSDIYNGSFSIDSPDGISLVTVAGVNFTLTELLATNTTPSNAINVGEGEIVITGFTQISTNLYEVQYEYTLLDNINHDGELDDGDATNNSSSILPSSTIAISVRDNDGDIADAELNLNIVDDTPSADIQYNEENIPTLTTLDEETIGSNESTAKASFSTLFDISNVSIGADNDASASSTITYTLAVKTATTGLTHAGESITVSVDSNGDIIGTTTSGIEVFKVSVDEVSGEVSLTQYEEIDHNAPDNIVGGTDEIIGLADGNVVLYATAVVTDSDEDTATGAANVDISNALQFEDDVPTIKNNQSDLLVKLDESDFDTGIVGQTSATISASAISGLFTYSIGADDTGSVTEEYSLIATDGVSTGLYLTGDTTEILLKENNDGSFSGYVDGDTTTNPVFTISINSATGEVTVTQYQAMEHSDDADVNADVNNDGILDHEETPLNLDDLIKVKLTITDADKDTVSATSEQSLDIRFLDDGPSAGLNDAAVDAAKVTNISLTVDESAGAQANPADNVSANSSEADFSSLFKVVGVGGVTASEVYGTDGAGSTSYSLSLTDATGTTVSGVASGLYALGVNGAKGAEILLSEENGEIVGKVGTTTYFTISNTGSTVTFTQTKNVWHSDTTSDNDTESLVLGQLNNEDVSINLTQTVTDADGDTDTATVALASSDTSVDVGVFNIKDDGPSAGLNDAAVDAAKVTNISLTVDESAGAQANPADNVSANSSEADFSSLFKVVGVGGVTASEVYGTDGAGSTSYSLSLTDATGTTVSGVASGLYALGVNGAKGAEILLSEENGEIVGKVGTTTYFTISNTGSTVTFTQTKNVWHSDTTSDNDTESLVLGQLNNEDVSINLTQTVTDADGDTDTATVALASSDTSVDVGVFNIKDDGPSAGLNDAAVDAAKVTNISLTVDESAGAQANPADNVSANSSEADFSSLFKVVGVGGVTASEVYGTDGAGSTSYSLSLTDATGTTVSGVASGLYALGVNGAKGAEILLSEENGEIVGKVGTTTYFTISNTGSTVTFTQTKNVWHSDTTSDNDTESLVLGQLNNEDVSINLTQTVTDADGDTDTATVALASSDTSVDVGVFNIKDDGPSAGLNDAAVDAAKVTNISLTVDESAGAQANPADNVSANSSEADFSSLFKVVGVGGVTASEVYGTDGAGSTSYSLSLTDATGTTVSGVASGLYALGVNGAKGAEILLSEENGEIVGKVGTTTYFTISNTGSTVTFTQTKNVWHSDTTSDNDTESLVLGQLNNEDVSINLTQTVTDADGDTDTATVALASSDTSVDVGVFNIKDDGPSAGLNDAAVDAAKVTNISLTVDESAGAQANPADNVSANSSEADFSSLFKVVGVGGVTASEVYGTDGAGSTSYSLSLTDATGTTVSGVASGLYALGVNGAKGAEILLSEENGEIVGKVGTTTYFTISNTGSTVTFTQTKNVWHSDTTSDNDTESLVLGQLNNEDVSINLTQTVTDADGDTDTATVALASSDTSVDVGVFNIKDDGPSAGLNDAAVDAAKVTNISLTVDESAGAQANPADNVSANSSEADFSSLFKVVGVGGVTASEVYGTDGAGSTSYSLSLTDATGTTVSGVASGLYALGVNGAKGAEILLSEENGEIVGKVGTTTYFTISNTGSTVTFTQTKNVWHSDTTSDNDTESLVLGQLNNEDVSINLTQTVTDADGDTDTATVALASSDTSVDVGVFNIKDDGPSAGLNDLVKLDDDTMPNGNAGGIEDDIDSSNATGTLNFDFGTDGAGSVELTGIDSNSYGLTATPNADGSLLSIYQDQGGANPVLVATITVDSATGDYTVTQEAPISHPTLDGLVGDDTENNVNFAITYDVKDADGDKVSGSLNINIDDDTPEANDTATTIDLNPEAVNLVFTLDVSGSMGNDVAGTSQTRLEIAIEAMEQVVADYQAQGRDVLIQVNTFSTSADSAENGKWMTASELSAFLNTLNDNGWTNYEDALAVTQTAYESSTVPTGTTYAYFISDGYPTVEMDDSTSTVGDVTDGNDQDGVDGATADTGYIDAARLDAWNAFVSNPANNIEEVFAVGIGTNVNESYLEQVSSDVTIVDDPADLVSTLQGTVVYETGSLDFSFGADGAADGTGTKQDGDKLAFTWETPTAKDSNGNDITNVTWVVSADGTLITGTNSNGEVVVKIEATDIYTNFPKYVVTQLDKESGIESLKVPYTITDGDGDSVTANLEIDVIIPVDDIPTITVEDALVDEDALPSINTTDTDGYNNVYTETKALTFDFGDDGAGSIQFTGNQTTSITAEGLDITLEYSNNNQTITGVDENGTPIFTISLDPANSEYTFTLHENVDHPQMNVEDLLSDLSLEVEIIDGNGTRATDTITIEIADDIASANDTNVSIDTTLEPINLVFTLDVSGSMGNGSGSKLEKAINAIKDLVSEYENQGRDVNVQINTFSSEVNSTSGWFDSADLNSKLNLTATGLTNYEDALYETQQHYTTPVEGDTYIYFLSDGVPTTELDDRTVDPDDTTGSYNLDNVDDNPYTFLNNEDTYLDQARVDAWDAFVSDPANNIQGVYAVGIEMTDDTYLKQISSDTTIVDSDDLSTQLLSTMINKSGDLDFSFGADGAADGTGIKLDDNKLAFEWQTPTAKDADGNDVSVDWTVSSDGQTIVGKINGDVVIKVEAKDITTDPKYEITQLDKDSGIDDLVMPFTVTDGDGDSASANLNIGIDDKPTIDPNPDLNDPSSIVYEKGLDDSSDDSEKDIGVFKITSPDGIAQVEIGGTTFTKAELLDTNNTNSSPIDTVEGTLIITGYDENTGLVSYEYTLKDNLDHPTNNNEIKDEISLKIVDPDGDDATGTLTVTIVDDVPVANADVRSMNEKTDTLSGNVYGNGQTGDVADDIGADSDDAPVYVTGVAKGNDTTNPVSGNVGSSFDGEYGKITLNSDGSYTYDLDNADSRVLALDDGQTLTEEFTYTITDSDGDTSTTTLTITIDGKTDNEPPVVTDASVRVSDEGLSGGLKDTTGENAGDDTTNKVVQTGSVASDPDGDALTVKLTAPTSTLTSEGKTVEWSGEDTDTLVGKINNGTTSNPDWQEVIKIEVDSNGDYTVTQLNQIDHPTNSVEDVVGFDVGVYVKDAKGATDTGTLNVVVEDDMPEANDTATTIDLNPEAVNLVFTLDVSGSMGNDVAGTSQTRLEIAIEAMEQVVADYQAQGRDVLIQVNTFSTSADSAENGKWMTASELSAFLNTLNDNGWTNYEDALAVTQTAYESSTVPTGTTYAYFISDGYPTVEMDDSTSTVGDVTDGNDQDGVDGATADTGYIDAARLDAWNAFVSNPANNIEEVFAVGIGTNVNESYLEQVSSDVTIVDDPADLVSTLQGTVVYETGSLDFSFGADGAADGTGTKQDGDKLAFTWETPTAKDSNGNDITNVTWVVSADGTLITGTNSNGEVVVKIEATDIYTNFPKYVVTQLDKESGIESLKVPYTITDGDGDSVTANLEIDVIIPVDDIPTITVEDALVDEDALPSINTTDTDGYNNVYTETKALTFDFGDDGAGSIQFTGNQTTSITAEGLDITLEYSNNNQTITGVDENGTPIFTISLDPANSEYTFTLHENVDHPQMNVEDLLSDLSLEVEIIDGNGTKATDTITIEIADDIASANDVSKTVEVDSKPVNLVFTLDVSSSMDNDVAGTSKTRLEIAKESIEDLISEYESQGRDVLIQINTFSTTAFGNGTWMSASEVTTYLTNLSDGGWTNYEDALQETVGSYSVSPNGGDTYVYFLSDGYPTVEMNDSTIYNPNDYTSGNHVDGFEDHDGTPYVDSPTLNTWNTFVNDASNNIAGVYSVGIGTNVSTTYLSLVSSNVLEVDNPADLSATLQGTVVNASGTFDFSFGADGAADGTGVKLDGDKEAFNWGDENLSDGFDEIIVSGSVGTVTWSYANDGVSDDLTTLIGKNSLGETIIKLTATGLDTATPGYTISQLDKDSGIETLTIPYTVTDGDGDSATANLNITINTPIDTNVITCEDISYTFTLDDFDSNATTVRIDSLPVLGTILLNGVAIAAPIEISSTDIDDGKLTFLPDLHQSGRDEYHDAGTGDQQNDYAQFNFSISTDNTATWTSTSSVMTIDVSPVADAPTLSVLGSTENTTTIDLTNVNDTSGGYTVKAYYHYDNDGDGELDEAPISIVTGTTHDGFGVQSTVPSGENPGNDTEINYHPGEGSEVIAIEFENALTSVDVSYAWKHSYDNGDGDGEVAIVDFYKDGVKIGSQEHYDAAQTDTIDGPYTFALPNGGSFDEIRISAKQEGDDFLIHDVRFTELVSSQTELTIESGNDAYFAISSELVDLDGSESFKSIIVDNLPEGFTISDGAHTFTATAALDYVDVKSWDMDAIKVSVPDGITPDEYVLTITAKSEESLNGEITPADPDNCPLEAQISSEFKLIVPDSLPVSYDETNSLVFGDATTNLLFTLDVSGSMNDGVKDSNDNWTTRFEIAKASVISTIQAYAANGETEVNLTLFNSCSANFGWMSTSQAIAFLNDLSMNNHDDLVYSGSNYTFAHLVSHDLSEHATNYYLGLEKTMDVDFNGHDADSTIAYFLSDGNPNNDSWRIDEDSDHTIVEWSNYVSNNIDKLNVIGVGSGATEGPLKIVQVQDGDEVLMVTDDSTLGNVLAGTVTASVNGNVLENISEGNGEISIDSIEVDGNTYTSANFPSSGVELDGDGTLTFDFTSGDYTYTAKSSEFSTDTSKLFSVTASDEDGDSTTVDVTIEVDLTPTQTENVIDLVDADTIDLSGVLSANTDAVDMTNSHANNLEINVDDLVIDDDQELKIFGDSDDKVTLEGGDSNWTSQGKEEINGEIFNVYQGTDGASNIKILIDEDVSIDPDL